MRFLLIVVLLSCVSTEERERAHDETPPAVCFALAFDDVGDDGSTDSIWLDEYQPWPRRIRYEQHQGVSLDGLLLFGWTFVYDSDGLLVEESYVDSYRTWYDWYTYDDRGNRVQDDFDDTGDGVPDTRTVFRFDESDNRVEGTIDHGLDGIIDRRLAYFNLPSGRVDRMTVDEADDGTVDDIYQYEWLHPDLEQYIVRIDRGADGTYDLSYEVHLDEDGHTIFQGQDQDGDDILETVAESEYNADGTIHHTTTTRWYDEGVVHLSFNDYFYTADGKSDYALFSDDDYSDGVFDERMRRTWDWDCP